MLMAGRQKDFDDTHMHTHCNIAVLLAFVEDIDSSIQLLLEKRHMEFSTLLYPSLVARFHFDQMYRHHRAHPVLLYVHIQH